MVLSEDHIPLDMRKTADLLTQFVPFTVNQKELITKLYAVLKKKAVDEKMYQYTQEILCIESADHPRLINEEVIIIDKDMCVI